MNNKVKIVWNGNFKVKSDFRQKHHKIIRMHVSHWGWENSVVFIGLSCVPCLKQVLKNGLRQNIIFAQKPRGEAPRQAEEEAAHVSTSATHTFKGRGSYLSLLALLSFPSWWHGNAKASSWERVCIFVRALKCHYIDSYHLWHTTLLSVSLQHCLHFNRRALFLFSLQPNADSLSASK